MSEVRRYSTNEAYAALPYGTVVVPASDYDALRAENERLQKLSVTNIILEIVPGDGDGHEVWAKSVADVNAAFCKGVDREEALERERDNLRAELAALKAVPDGVEVVGYRWKTEIPETLGGGYGWSYASHWSTGPKDAEPLMPVAQHNARMAEKDAETEALAIHHRQWQVRAARTRRELEQELTALRQPVAGEREAFQAWAWEAYETKYWWDMTAMAVFAVNIDGEYRNPLLNNAWPAWQARAALSAPAAGQDAGALVEALGQTRIDLVILRGSFAQAAKYDHKAEGMDDEIGKWIGRIDDALVAHKAGGGHHE